MQVSFIQIRPAGKGQHFQLSCMTTLLILALYRTLIFLKHFHINYPQLILIATLGGIIIFNL